MKIKVLMDNNTFIDQYFLGEPAVSYYIETEGKRILFDVGYSAAFIKNAEDMGVDLDDINTVVLSHGHNDHTGGLGELIKIDFKEMPELIAHTDVFLNRVADGLDIGCPICVNEIKKSLKISLSKEPVWITDKLVFLGEIPVLNDFEQRYSIGKIIESGKEIEDYMYDDSAIAYMGEKGLYIITGCSHSGICNIIAYAKKITGVDKIAGILGGLHLFDANARTISTVRYLVDENIEELYPCHCTSFNIKARMASIINVNEVGVGLELNWE